MTTLNILRIEVIHSDDDVVAYGNINQKPIDVSIVFNNPANVCGDQVIAHMFIVATQIDAAEFDVVDVSHKHEENDSI